MSVANTDTIAIAWQAQWENALAVWSRYTRLRPPLFCHDDIEARKQGLTDSFAMIRFHDQTIVINLPDIVRRGLNDYALEILAHEIGHHVLVPGNLTEHARMLGRMRKGLPTLERYAPMIANLYTDLLINDQLQRSAQLSMNQVFQRLHEPKNTDRLWALYMRIYEILWQQTTGSLGGRSDNDSMEGDAWLGAKLIRVYARDWQAGAGGFAALMLPYLLNNDALDNHIAQALMDTRNVGMGEFPSGLVALDESELQDVLHPALDPLVSDNARAGTNEASGDTQSPPGVSTAPLHPPGQCREPFEYGEILRASGIDLSEQDIAIRYYRERALPHLVKFPQRRKPDMTESVPEGTIVWEPGEALEHIDWFQTLTQSPVVIPGITTQQRVWGNEPSPQRQMQPVDLDLYVDCSGSMPNPQVHSSYTALAGAILCLSALRAGASVQVTLWSGAHEFVTTEGFSRHEETILRVLTGYLGGATAFPIHILRDTYLAPHNQLTTQHNVNTRAKAKERKHDTHIVILSDDGVTTLFDQDEKGNSGWDVSREALARAGAGGTMVLNLPYAFDNNDSSHYWQSHADVLKRAHDEQGWAIHSVANWEDMVAFAQDFGRRHFQSVVNV